MTTKRVYRKPSFPTLFCGSDPNAHDGLGCEPGTLAPQRLS